MKFKSRKDSLFRIFLWGICLLCLVALWFMAAKPQDDFISSGLILFLTLALLLWLNFGTYYKLTPENLYYRCGPFRGAIEVSKIREIIKGKTLWAGLRPATAGKGLIVKYGKYDQIYISPKTNDAFIKEITELNPDIKITLPKK